MLTLIDFHADWCGPCHAMDPILDKVVGEMTGKIELQKIDVDAEPEKAQSYGVMGIPTLVILKEGKEVSRKTGLQMEPVLRQWIESNL